MEPRLISVPTTTKYMKKRWGVYGKGSMCSFGVSTLSAFKEASFQFKSPWGTTDVVVGCGVHPLFVNELEQPYPKIDGKCLTNSSSSCIWKGNLMLWFRSLALVARLLLFFFHTNMKQLINWIASNMKPNSLMN